MIISTLRGAALSFCQGNDLSPEYRYGSAVAKPGQPALSDEKRAGIILAVQSAFTKLRNLYRDIVPIFESYGFSAPSPGAIARDLSEKIEASVVQHCPSFSEGIGHCDLSRASHDWEVKICQDSGLTINQSKQIAGENYIVVNYKANSQVTRVCMANSKFASIHHRCRDLGRIRRCAIWPSCFYIYWRPLPDSPVRAVRLGGGRIPARQAPAADPQPFSQTVAQSQSL
jgi:hypothetical protein